MDRRGFLGLMATAGLVGLAGCTSDPGPSPAPTRSSSPPGPTLPDDTLRALTLASETELVERYAAAIRTAEPTMAEFLRTLQVQHVEHAQRLRPDSPVGTDQPGASGSPTTAIPRPRAMLASLAEAEGAALQQRRDACEQAEDPELARTLCLIAASEGQHVDELRQLRAGLGR